MTAVTPEYCLMMARYNAWQNRQLRGTLERMTDAALREERGAFFGSILGTVNHLLWGDMIWLARFEGREGPAASIAQSPAFQPTLAAWGAERFRTDSRLLLWAERMTALELTGRMSWFSGAAGRDVSKPIALCVTHMFNHQTHHRGQVHAMLTQAGERPGDTDLFLMPEDGPWL